MNRPRPRCLDMRTWARGLQHEQLVADTDAQLYRLAKPFGRPAVRVDRRETVDEARSYLLGSYPLGRQHLSSRRSALLSYTLMDRPLNYSEQYKASIRAVTRQDLQALIERFLNPGEEVLGVLQGGREQS